MTDATDRPILWTPSPERAQASRLAQYQRWLKDKPEQQLMAQACAERESAQ